MGKGDRKHKKHKKKKKTASPPAKKRSEKTIKDFGDLFQKNNIDGNNNELKKDGKKVSYEILKEDIKYNKDNSIHFLKWSAKYDELDGTKVKDMTDFETNFPFANSNDKNNSKFKNTEFALAWFKDKIKSSKQYKISLTGNTHSNLDIKELSGIIKEGKLQEFVNSLIPYSFILHAKIRLKSLYYSSDDDSFYLIQNPCLKEKVFKVPMVRGSGWKGVIAKAGKELINEDLRWFESNIRVLGTGSDEYRKLLDSLEKNKVNFEKIINYVLFELGLKLKNEDIKEIKSNPVDYLKKLTNKFTKENIKNIPYLQTHKGRAIFYPTYFDKLSLEIINPHSRKTRAGTTPIHYEVVPKGTEGILQIVYVPYDGILTKDEDLKTQIENDIKFLTKCIEKASNIGIGAKEKLGWGRFELLNIKKKCNKNNLEICEE